MKKPPNTGYSGQTGLRTPKGLPENRGSKVL